MNKYERKAQSQRKHTPFNSGASRAPITGPSSRPEWKGPGFIKKAVKSSQPPSITSTSSVSTPLQPRLLPQDLQQLILNIFRDAFPASIDFDSLKPTLQEVKDALDQKDLVKAFGTQHHREAYVVRWSASRALAYANVLAWICGEVAAEEAWVKDFMDGLKEKHRNREPSKVVCIGGSAAELMAFAALVKFSRPECGGQPAGKDIVRGEDGEAASSQQPISEKEEEYLLNLRFLDVADWSEVIYKLNEHMTSRPKLSKYASASARASNASFIRQGMIDSKFSREDVLRPEATMPLADTNTLRSLPNLNILGSSPTLITLFFTLNELYTTSRPRTTALLLNITLAAAKDSLLLVIDSPGAYSETTIGKASEAGEEASRKKHFMHWLLDYTLLNESVHPKTNVTEEMTIKAASWEKIKGEEARSFKLLEGLKYPASLENMRFQIHLYRRL